MENYLSRCEIDSQSNDPAGGNLVTGKHSYVFASVGIIHRRGLSQFSYQRVLAKVRAGPSDKPGIGSRANKDMLFPDPKQISVGTGQPQSTNL
jgi:hypothetical protein